MEKYIPSQGSVTIFTTTWCTYCKALKRQLDRLGIPYSEVNIETEAGAPELVEQLNGGNQVVPTVIFPDSSVETNPRAALVKEKLGL